MQSIRHLVYGFRPIGRQSLWNSMDCTKRLMCTSDANGKSVEKPQISLVDNPPALDKMVQNHDFQIDWDKEMHLIEVDEHECRGRSVLAPVDDESKIYAEPMLQPTFNLAAYVQKSETLQQLLNLGVNLHQLDKSLHTEFIATLDFQRDISPYVMFFTKDVGVSVEQMGKFLTKNPEILKRNLDDIQVRINYLQLKRFNQDEIVQIITKNPMWLNYPTREIDERLGFFQKDFDLIGNEVRALAVACPRLITHDMQEIRNISFSVREECCFEKHEVKNILLKCPKFWMMHRFDFMERYDFVSHHMKIENSQLAMTPFILTNRLFRIKERHGFLKHIKRAQYNPKLPLYISLDDLCIGTDETFAENIAKRPYEEFESYLRTL
ncbi:transcription termination factor 3, mitochondrial [Contarinia nasturtii]|uniref:transcription termination factor 3, mitochondrial n=1 Tax=Contarinia nasturtii TaxID=265458 RepID=UPI0012D3D80B|nr:transcription termination factor 3, mitochondrial [Contarinia nasturtii]